MYSGQLWIIGAALVFLGILVIMLDLILSLAPKGTEGDGERRVSGGGVVIIGPVPIIFGTDKRAALTATIIGAVLTLFLVLLYLYVNGVIRW